MVHVIYDVNSGGLNNFFPIFEQSGEGMIQKGNGQFFQGVRYQRGYGIGYPRQRGAGLGSLLKSVWHIVSPWAKSIGQTLTKEGLSSGARILENIAQGADAKEAIITEGKRSLRGLAQKASNELKQRGSGGIAIDKSRKRNKKSKSKPIHNRSHIIGRSVPTSAVKKRRRVDSLGFY